MGQGRARGRRSISISIIMVTDVIIGRDGGAMRMGRKTTDAGRAMVIGTVIVMGGGREVLE